jgi:DNA primase
MDDIEEIKKRIDIVELINGYVPLKKAGVNYKALCPFHKEDTPSFMVSPEKQIWHCFGCQKGGDQFTFIQEMEGLEFRDTLKLLADRAGVKLKKVDLRATQKKAELSDINEAAANFYHQILLHPKAGKQALAYLKNRGLNLQIIRDFQIGFAPNQWEATFHALTIKKNFKPEEIERAGLIIRSTKTQSKSPYYDRFRNRIMFPIRNIAGTVIGFSGRTLESDPKSAKYINTPETPIFNKSRTLFGLDRARQAIRKEDLAILVEGQMDVVSAHQAGFINIVATSGTALTPDHLEILKKYTENIAFAFDTDRAGEAAAKRAIETANAAGVNAKLVILPSGEDPDSLIKKDPTKFRQAIKAAQNAMEFYFISAFADLPKELSVDDKRKITKELLPIIKKIADPVIQGEYLQKLSQRLGTEEKYLSEAMAKIIPSPAYNQKQSVQKLIPRKDKIEEKILAALIAFPDATHGLIKKLLPTDFSDQSLAIVYRGLKKLYNTNGSAIHLNSNTKIDLKKIKNISSDLIKKLDLLILKIQNDFVDLSEKEIFQEIGLLINRLRSSKFDVMKKDFEMKIREAEDQGDRQKVKKLIKSFQVKIIEAGEQNG